MTNDDVHHSKQKLDGKNFKIYRDCFESFASRSGVKIRCFSLTSSTVTGGGV